MATYGTPAPARVLYDEITGQSSDYRERLALLNGRAKLGEHVDVVAEVRGWLWADIQRAARP